MNKNCVECNLMPKAKGHSRCSGCHKMYRANEYSGTVNRLASRYRLKQRVFVDSIKNLPCSDCGGRFPSECMDFDHRDPELKLFEIGPRSVSFTEDGLRRVNLEVSKCDLVCANCHRIRTKKQSIEIAKHKSQSRLFVSKTKGTS